MLSLETSFCGWCGTPLTASPLQGAPCVPLPGSSGSLEWLIAAFIHTGCLDPAVWIRMQHEACMARGPRFKSIILLSFNNKFSNLGCATEGSLWRANLSLTPSLAELSLSLPESPSNRPVPNSSSTLRDSNGSVALRGGRCLALSWLRKEQVDEGVESTGWITRWWNRYQEVLWNFPQEGSATEMQFVLGWLTMSTDGVIAVESDGISCGEHTLNHGQEVLKGVRSVSPKTGEELMYLPAFQNTLGQHALWMPVRPTGKPRLGL